MARGNKKGGKRRGDDSDDDDDEAAPKAAAPAAAGGKTRKDKRQQEKQQQGKPPAVQNAKKKKDSDDDDDDSDDDGNLQLLLGGGGGRGKNRRNLSDDDDEDDHHRKAPAKGKQQAKQQPPPPKQQPKGKGKARDDSDDDDDDDDERPNKSKKQAAPPPKQQQPKRRGKKGAVDSDDDDDDDDEDEKLTNKKQPPPQPKKQQKGRNKKGGDDSDDEDEDEIIPLSKKQQKKQPPPPKKQAKRNRKGGRDSDEDDDDDDEQEDVKPKIPLSKKQQKKQQQHRRQEDSDDEDEDSEEEEEVKPVLPVSKKQQKKQQQQKQRFQLDDDDDEEEDDEEEEEEEEKPVVPQPKLSKKQLKKQQQQQKQSKNDNHEEEDHDDDDDDVIDEELLNELVNDEDMDNDDDEPVEQIAVVLLDDDFGESKKKKKKKKKSKEEEAAGEHDDEDHGEKKKKKKDKKEKKKEGKTTEDQDDAVVVEKETPVVTDPVKEITETLEKSLVIEEVVPPPAPAVEPAPASSTSVANGAPAAETVETPKPEPPPPKKKSKLELQIEAALQKKQKEKEEKEEKERALNPPEPAKGEKKPKGRRVVVIEEPKEEEIKEPEPPPPVVAPTPPPEPAKPEEHKGPDRAEGEEDDVFYGAPDDVVWSDKSHAQRAAEEAGLDGDDDHHMVGADGKKLSNKQRKKLLKDRQAAEREAEYEAKAAKASREGAQFACSQTAFNENDPQWENAMDVNIPNFSISAAGKILFKDASLTLGHGRRYGLVGPNGRGKSTLLKMIASRDLKLPPRIDFLYVEQEVVADDTPAVDAVLKADQNRWDLLEEEKTLMEAIDKGDESPEKIERLQIVLNELQQMGSDSSEAKARRILYGLGFTMEMQTKPTKMFSGGWRMRISLARALFIEPTLLMLDEPTNHLDLNAVIWLDEYLQRWKKTLLVVSHDQDFLNSVCEEILHIEDLKLISYKGNYDNFKKAEKAKFVQQVKAWEKQEKRLRELKRSGQSKAKATETVKKALKREPGARNQKQQNNAIASGSEAVESTELIKRPREYFVRLEFAEVAELSRPVIEVNNVHFRYSPKHPIIFEKIDFGIDMDSRITIVGPNGAGKSTLLKLLTGELDPTTGDVRRNPRLRMGIYNQHFVDRLPMNKTPVEHLKERFDGEDYQSIRNRLGKYGLEGHAHEVVMRDLSGGQKARVVFVELSLQKPHVLLLDEPTNNLDIETIDALLDAINAFNGGVVVVTHDQRLIEQCDCTLWVVEKLGVTKWEAGFDDYKATILRELEEQVERESAARREKLEAAAVAKAEKLALLAHKIRR